MYIKILKHAEILNTTRFVNLNNEMISLVIHTRYEGGSNAEKISLADYVMVMQWSLPS